MGGSQLYPRLYTRDGLDELVDIVARQCTLAAGRIKITSQPDHVIWCIAAPQAIIEVVKDILENHKQYEKTFYFYYRSFYETN